MDEPMNEELAEPVPEAEDKPKKSREALRNEAAETFLRMTVNQISISLAPLTHAERRRAIKAVIGFYELKISDE